MLAVLQGIILTMLYSRTPDSFIINLNDKEDDFLFATERYDRKILDTSKELMGCLLYTSLSPRDGATSRMPSSA